LFCFINLIKKKSVLLEHVEGFLVNSLGQVLLLVVELPQFRKYIIDGILGPIVLSVFLTEVSKRVSTNKGEVEILTVLLWESRDEPSKGSLRSPLL
jgi:hypothetical protein